MKILITGGTGLVGSEIIHLCKLRGIEVNYLTTSKSKIKNSDFLQGFLWNPAKGEIDANCIEGVQAIINLAGATIVKRWSKSYKKTILQSRVDSLHTLYSLLSRQQNHEVTSLVSASAIGIYPSSLSNYYKEEDDVSETSFLNKVVSEWENAADKFLDLNLKVSKIRIGLVLAQEGGALPKMAKPIKFYAGAPLGSGEQWQSWIHITDLAELFLFAIKKNLIGVYNGVAPNPVTNSKLTKEIATVLKKPLILPHVPEWFLRLVLGEMANVLFDSQRVSAKKIETLGFSFTYPNISGALEDILSPDRELTSKQELAS
ncbi:TIGR01777 family oxidoreductase [Ascidiimonas sp. W6]|uniref:TIGR01777 family oxidoreductase n=1 Tax=Ascidiimonas meishanensis TaxID=3128903 RepID=UPI0030ED2B4B